MIQLAIMREYCIKLISVVLLAVFILNSLPLAGEAYALAPWTGTEQPAMRREAEKMRLELGGYLKCAVSADDKHLLEIERASVLLLPTSEILASEETYNDPAKLVRAVNHEKTEAIMRIVAWEEEESHRDIYESIRGLILPENKKQNNILAAYYGFFSQEPSLPPNLLLNDIVAKAFELLIPLKNHLIRRDELTPEEILFINAIEPVITSRSGRR